MTRFEISAIIGFRRSGASPEQIASIVGVTFFKIVEIIRDYKETLDPKNFGNL